MFRPNVCFPPVCLTILRRGYQRKHLLLIVEDKMNHGEIIFGARPQTGFLTLQKLTSSVISGEFFWSEILLLWFYKMKLINIHPTVERMVWYSLARCRCQVWEWQLSSNMYHYGVIFRIPYLLHSQWWSFSTAKMFSSHTFTHLFAH